ncbi:hypothetical protein BD779DRAFT_1572560 [Infundibulicybe gibba]|nr:hypothetical protein BD779DRAFT_1572560 [Infundibulicybe gibba]
MATDVLAIELGTAALIAKASDWQRQLNTNNYLNVISYTILVDEYLLTLPDEIYLFWSSRITWASFFFYLNRYLTLFGHIPVMVQSFWSTDSPTKAATCHHLQVYHQYFAVVVQVAVAVLLIMRMYALYDRSRAVLVLFIVVALGIIGFGCWAILAGEANKQVIEFFWHIGCAASVSERTGKRLALAWGGLLLFDTMVFAMTLYKSLTLRREPGVETLLSVLLRDGSIYFGLMVASNLGNILTFLFGDLFIRGSGTTLTNVISSTAISRLMLNLRDPTIVARGAPNTIGSSYPATTTFLHTSDTSHWAENGGSGADLSS